MNPLALKAGVAVIAPGLTNSTKCLDAAGSLFNCSKVSCIKETENLLDSCFSPGSSNVTFCRGMAAPVQERCDPESFGDSLAAALTIFGDNAPAETIFPCKNAECTSALFGLDQLCSDPEKFDSFGYPDLTNATAAEESAVVESVVAEIYDDIDTALQEVCNQTTSSPSAAPSSVPSNSDTPSFPVGNSGATTRSVLNAGAGAVVAGLAAAAYDLI